MSLMGFTEAYMRFWLNLPRLNFSAALDSIGRHISNIFDHEICMSSTIRIPKSVGSIESHYTYNFYTYTLYMHLFHSVWRFKEKSKNKRYLINACFCLYWLYTCTWLEVLINIEMYSNNLPQNLDRYRGILPRGIDCEEIRVKKYS